jgi:hypothetical protein
MDGPKGRRMRPPMSPERAAKRQVMRRDRAQISPLLHEIEKKRAQPVKN